MSDLFDKHGGFRKLHSFTLATIVQIETLRFCRRFRTFDHRQAGSKFYDPKGRQYDQTEDSDTHQIKKVVDADRRATRQAPVADQWVSTNRLWPGVVTGMRACGEEGKLRG